MQWATGGLAYFSIKDAIHEIVRDSVNVTESDATPPQCVSMTGEKLMGTSPLQLLKVQQRRCDQTLSSKPALRRKEAA